MSNSNNGQATAFILPSPVLFRTSTLGTYNMPSDRNLRFSMARMAKGKGGGGPRAKATGGKKKKKKAKGPEPGGGKNKNGGNKKSRKKKDSNPVPGSNGKSPSVHLPPWQIMSEKDAKANIKSEKVRRDSIRSGEIASSTSNQEKKVGDVSASSSLISLTDRQLFNWKRFRPDKDIGGMEFIGGYLGTRLPPLLGVPEVAFLGRSNVGKSSLLNELSKKASGEIDSARVGQTPGATASVNLYSLNRKKAGETKPLLGFADLPGFGYAKLSKEVKESVEMAAERYLGRRRELALGILLVDIRRIPSDDDRAVLAALYDLGIPLLVVATKVDKIRSKNALPIALEEVRVGLGLPEGQPLCISSVTGAGVKQLWSIILDACEDKVDELKEEVETGKKNSPGRDEDETIKLDDEGNWIDEPTDEGLDWIQSFSYHDDNDQDASSYQSGQGNSKISEESRRKMKENEDLQAAQNESQKVKNLKKVARQMQRKGEL